MKPLLTLALVVFCLMAEGNSPYRSYLVSSVALQTSKLKQAGQQPVVKTSCVIPRYEIPKGNVFCRMEDKLTRSTGLWLKIGVK